MGGPFPNTISRPLVWLAVSFLRMAGQKSAGAELWRAVLVEGYHVQTANRVAALTAVTNANKIGVK